MTSNVISDDDIITIVDAIAGYAATAAWLKPRLLNDADSQARFRTALLQRVAIADLAAMRVLLADLAPSLELIPSHVSRALVDHYTDLTSQFITQRSVKGDTHAEAWLDAKLSAISRVDGSSPDLSASLSANVKVRF